MKNKITKTHIGKQYTEPLILAPAGNRASFFAALAAGANAIYCGLKEFSARSGAKNFNINELSKFAILAKNWNVQIYVAINAMLKPNEIRKAQKIVSRLKRDVNPDAVIVQDLGFIRIIRESGFIGQIHMSTLANVSFPSALIFVEKALNVSCVVVPRELSLDEIKIMSKACAKNVKLEIFVHGALCYAISGRCYWSSYLGGRSSLRGNCVQPCRRIYSRKGALLGRVFSCYDLALGALAGATKNIPQIHSWKIEGRKKGPHYVFNTVSAYRVLRDHSKNEEKQREAKKLLENCLGRKGTYCNFLSEKRQNPISIGKHTNSGMFLGKVEYDCQKPFLFSNIALLIGDVLRIGYEDESSHYVIDVKCFVPIGKKFYLKLDIGNSLSVGTPVFLKDRKEKFLTKLIEKINIDAKLIECRNSTVNRPKHKTSNKKYIRKKKTIESNMQVTRKISKPKIRLLSGVWLYDSILQDIGKIYKKDLWIWLPPIIWPKSEPKIHNLIRNLLKIGMRNFILNMPWQMVFFENAKKLILWAGPFCNISNSKSLEVLRDMGFQGAIVSPELSFYDYIILGSESPISLGIVISGNWPLSISRHISKKIELNSLFNSPKNEGGWIARYGNDHWIFPNWKLDITKQKNRLLKSGYSMFVNLLEPIPAGIKLKKRPGMWNSKIGLK